MAPFWNSNKSLFVLSLRALFLLPQKPVFDFGVDPVQPLLGSIRPVSIGRDLRLELCNAILSGPQLVRKLLSHIDCVAAVLFSHAGGLVKQTQDRVPCFVELIAIAKAPAFRVNLGLTVHGQITHFDAPSSKLRPS